MLADVEHRRQRVPPWWDFLSPAKTTASRTVRFEKGANLMALAEFSYSGEAYPLPGGRALVRGTRTSGGGRTKKHVFIEVECLPEEVGAVQNALAVLLQRHGRINATSF